MCSWVFEIDNRRYFSPEIDDSPDVGWCVREVGNPRIFNNFPHLEKVYGKMFIAKKEFNYLDIINSTFPAGPAALCILPVPVSGWSRERLFVLSGWAGPVGDTGNLLIRHVTPCQTLNLAISRDTLSTMLLTFPTTFVICSIEAEVSFRKRQPDSMASFKVVWTIPCTSFTLGITSSTFVVSSSLKPFTLTTFLLISSIWCAISLNERSVCSSASLPAFTSRFECQLSAFRIVGSG